MINNKRQLTRRAGFTLMEIMVAMGIGAILLTVIMALSLYSGRSFAAMYNYVDLNQRSLQTLDLITRDIRQAMVVTSFATNEMSFIYPGPDAARPEVDARKLTLSWNPKTKEFTRALEGEPIRTNLVDCEQLEFSMFQRTTKPNEWVQDSTTRTDQCKEVGVRWVCSRKILGITRNTESVQTAKIVLRQMRAD